MPTLETGGGVGGVFFGGLFQPTPKTDLLELIRLVTGSIRLVTGSIRLRVDLLSLCSFFSNKKLSVTSEVGALQLWLSLLGFWVCLSPGRLLFQAASAASHLSGRVALLEWHCL